MIRAPIEWKSFPSLTAREFKLHVAPDTCLDKKHSDHAGLLKFSRSCQIHSSFSIMVSPTKASSSRQSKSSKRAAHPQRNTSNGKSSSLSAEYILDSESSEPRDEALSRPNGTKSDQSKEPFPISQQRASSSTLDVLKTQSKAQFRANKERVSLSSKTSSEPDEISSGKSSRSEEISGSDTGTSSEDGLRESGGASRKLRKEVSAACAVPNYDLFALLLIIAELDDLPPLRS